MTIERGKGNLLTADVDALVNTVNTEGVMGKGLALQFKKAFPENFASYERACKSGEVKTGQMHIVQRLASTRFIINFPTKRHWRQPSRLEYVRDGLQDSNGRRFVLPSSRRSPLYPRFGSFCSSPRMRPPRIRSSIDERSPG